MRARTVRVDRWEKTPTRTAQDKIKIKNPGRQQPCWGSLFCTNLTQPTTALDVTIQAQILDLMNQLKKETGTSILFITHDLGVVAEVCDDVAVMYCGRVVERGDVKTIFANPSHPYTKGLLGSIPRLGDAGKELKSIPGNVPNPKYMPKGCKFEPRCPYASEKCREEEPGFFQIEEGHISRCWLCESGQLKTDHVEKAGD